jgi:hypothetical protein
MKSTVHFAERVVYSTRFRSSSASHILNILSDHDVQYLMINNIAAAHNTFQTLNKKVSNETMKQFQLLLKTSMGICV